MQVVNKLKAILKSYRQKKTQPNYKSSNRPSDQNRNIIYILPKSKVNSGGDKVIFRQSEKINRLGLGRFQSQILHPFDMAASEQVTSFSQQASFKQNLIFNLQNDFVVVPEILATPDGNQLAKLGIKYAIFVQGGYIMDTPLYLWSRDDLDAVYKGASLILSISDDTTENIKRVFPEYADKVMRIFLSVDNKTFKPSVKKKNWIAYMPRRLDRHAELIQFFLKNKLPDDWKFVPISNMDENGVADVLGQSKIFLALSELEGLGLPPIEAAIAGNYVIGYTAQGGKEFWKLPVFTKVEHGDIKGFCEAILDRVSLYDIDTGSDALLAQQALAKTFSDSAETASLTCFLDKVNQLLDAG